MKIENNVIYADEGKIFRRKSDQSFCGNVYYLGYIYYLNGKKLDEPLIEKVEDFEEVPENLPEIIKKQYIDEHYPLYVESFIREKYSQSAELAIHRQRDTKPEAFKEYFDYCEGCKIRAKQMLGIPVKIKEPAPVNEETPSESV